LGFFDRGRVLSIYRDAAVVATHERVRDGAYRNRDDAWSEQPWEEKVSSEGNLDLVKSSAVDGNLIDLGNRAREPRWPIDNP
jgi:hypothetical protein